MDADPWLLRLDNLQHLATRLTGTLREPTHVLELVGALHPTAAVGGTPREVAVPLIGSLEGMDRARYAGPVGVVRGNGDGTFGIALRCAQLTARRARLFAGCGIVAGSLPEAELEETRLKLNTMQGGELDDIQLGCRHEERGRLRGQDGRGPLTAAPLFRVQRQCSVVLFTVRRSTAVVL